MKTKKVIPFFGLLLAMGTASAMFTSCSDDDAAGTTLSPTAISVDAIGAVRSIVITSNSEWKVSNDVRGWCIISPTSGTGNGTVTVEVLENTTTKSRVANVNVTTETTAQTVIVTQEAAPPTLILNTSLIQASAADTTLTVVVTSNSEWKVSSDAEWCTISPTSGADNGQFTVVVAQNTTSDSRLATITATAAPVTITKTVTVTQTATATPFVEPEMILVAGGTVSLGYPGTAVIIGSFRIGKYEVTQKVWYDIMGHNPSTFKGDKLPVEWVSHKDIQTFLAKLNEKTGKNYRLPTEAEWEYAAMGGQNTQNHNYSGSATVGSVAWYKDNSGNTTHPVGEKDPNELGIYDMSGNVSEWCSDWYDGNHYPSGTDNPTGADNPTGVEQGWRRVERGGSWNGDATGCSVFHRGNSDPNLRHNGLGFRLVLPAP
ncbi:hypothetical protein AGMMS49965_01420 [Bacteroidia bacterium]|nr:hypothetical protein AGMMS49965_01420 [Bacteroidia bacterium]